MANRLCNDRDNPSKQLLSCKFQGHRPWPGKAKGREAPSYARSALPLIRVIPEHRIDAAGPFAVEAFQQFVGGGLAGFRDGEQGVEEVGFVVAPVVVARPAGQPVAGDRQHLAGHVLNGAGSEGRAQGVAGDAGAKARAFLRGPVLHQIPRGIERHGVVEEADPQGRQGAQAAPGAAVGTAHLQVLLQPHLGEQGGQVVHPVGHQRRFPRQDGQPAGQEVAERQARGVDVGAVAVDEVHRRVEGVVGVALEPETVLEHEGQVAGAVGVGVGPDVAAERLEAVGPPLGEGGVGEQRRGDGLQRQ